MVGGKGGGAGAGAGGRGDWKEGSDEGFKRELLLLSYSYEELTTKAKLCTGTLRTGTTSTIR